MNDKFDSTPNSPDIDLASTVIQLDVYTRFNTLLIEYIIDNLKPAGFSQETIDNFMQRAVDEMNKKYGSDIIEVKPVV